MEYLPPNLILKILEYIPIRNRLKLRSISKQFKEIIDFIIPDELILDSHEGFLDDNLLIIKDEELFYSTYLVKFKRIKKLKSNLKSDYLISADYYFNLFEELIELSIYNLYSYRVDINLKLKKLKKLECTDSIGNILKLDTPSLIELEIENLNNFNIIYPDKLLNLRIASYSFRGPNLSELYKFKNLEQLKFENNFSSMTILNKKLFKRLINLKILIITDMQLNNSNRVNQHESKINQIKRFNYRRKNLEIFINGLKIDQFKHINVDNNFNFWIKSSIENSSIENSLIKKLFESNKIELGSIVYDSNDLNYQLLTKFHTIITNVNSITIKKKIKDESKLINFIKKFNPENLNIETELSKSFYRQLNNENASVTDLDFSKDANLILSDNESDCLSNFIFNPEIRYLCIYINSSSDFKFLTRSIINYNLQNNLISLCKYDNTFSKFMNFYIYGNNFTITINHCSRGNHLSFGSKIGLVRFEFLQILNLMRQLFVDDEFDRLELFFLIEKINLINSSYSIMIKKLSKTYYISKEIFYNIKMLSITQN